MGAWIEIEYGENFPQEAAQVAPFMGAWIEIGNCYKISNEDTTSHPLWVRGLKYF